MRGVWLALLILLSAAPAEGRGGIVRGGGAANPGIRYPWRFAYVTDTHINWAFGGTTPRNSYMLTRCIDTLNTIQQTAGGMDLLVFGGDGSEDIFQLNTNGATDTLNALIARSRFPWYPVLGNWDVTSADTLALRSPYYTYMQRFAAGFNGSPYWAKDWKNVRFLSVQDIPDYNIGDPLDYRRNNPFNYAGTGGTPAYDYDGIASSTSPQRVYIQNNMTTKDASHWIVAMAHRPCFGSSTAASNRLNFTRNYRTNHWLHDIETRLGTGERGLVLVGDQHIPLWFTKAIYDSAVASATGKGLYHLVVTSGGGARSADTTEMLGGTSLAAFTYSTGTGVGTRVRGRTSTAWQDTVTTAGDAKQGWMWTFSLFTVYADNILVETFRVFDGVTPSKYTLGYKTRLIDSRTITRDN